MDEFEKAQADSDAGAGQAVVVAEPVSTEPTRIPGRNGGTLTPFTRASSLAANAARWERDRAAFLSGIGDAYDELPDMKPALTKSAKRRAVIRRIGNEHAQHACKAGEANSAASARIVLEVLKPSKAEAAGQGGGGVSIVVNGDVAIGLVSDVD